MKYVITENQNLFIRRINMIDEFLTEFLLENYKKLIKDTYDKYINKCDDEWYDDL